MNCASKSALMVLSIPVGFSNWLSSGLNMRTCLIPRFLGFLFWTTVFSSLDRFIRI